MNCARERTSNFVVLIFVQKKRLACALRHKYLLPLQSSSYSFVLIG